MKNSLRAMIYLLVCVFATTVMFAQATLEMGWYSDTPNAAWSAGSDVVAGLPVHWGDVNLEDGSWDWAMIDDHVDRLREQGAKIKLVLSSRHASRLPTGGYPKPSDTTQLTAWINFVERAAERYHDKVQTIQIGSTLPSSKSTEEIRQYGFLLKRSALAVRSVLANKNSKVDIAQATVLEPDVEAQRLLWEDDAAAYVDRISLRVDTLESATQIFKGFFKELVEHPPAATLEIQLSEGLPDSQRVAIAVSLLAEGADRVTLLRSGSDPTSELDLWLNSMVAIFKEGYAPNPSGKTTVVTDDGDPWKEGSVLGRFTRKSDFRSLIIYLVPSAPPSDSAVRLLVSSSFVRDAYAINPLEEDRLRTGTKDIDGQKAIRAPIGEWPRAVEYSFAVSTPGFEVPPEDLDVQQTRGLTAEEIIARNQAVSQAQRDRLDRWIAKGQARINFSFSQGAASVDWSIDGRYFWDRENGLEWEQREHYINGNRLPWKKIPEIPQIQPEKVVTLPLDLNLDKRYRYRLVGEGEVRGKATYILEFQPETKTDESLYRGRVWIDKQTFQTLRTSLIQDGLDAPVRANEERDLYAPFAGSDGEYFLISEIEGQQIWSIGGRNVTVQREVIFEQYEINPPLDSFEQARADAYASNNLILRDTDEGLKYLSADKDGNRVLKEDVDTTRWFAAAGILKDTSTDGVAPLAGVNYFNFDTFGKGWQTNVLFGGLVALANASKPDLFGGRADFTAEAALFALRFEDTFYVGDTESLFESVRERPQTIQFRLGLPMGQFAKTTLTASTTFVDYAGEEDAEAAVAAFNTTEGRNLRYDLPEDHVRTGAALQFEFNRRGYKLSARGEWNHRSKWSNFGLFDVDAGSYLAFDGTDANDPLAYSTVPDPELFDTFSQWRAVAAKEWFLPHFQKIRTELNYLDGKDLDRFSRYEFSFFGSDRLSGFAGSGVRFDEGLLARAGYAFNLFEAIRFELGVEGASVSTLGGPSQQFEGVGLLANFVGPWKTVINLNVGYSIGSDIPGLEGETEIFLLVLKLF